MVPYFCSGRAVLLRLSASPRSFKSNLSESSGYDIPRWMLGIERMHTFAALFLAMTRPAREKNWPAAENWNRTGRRRRRNSLKTLGVGRPLSILMGPAPVVHDGQNTPSVNS